LSYTPEEALTLAQTPGEAGIDVAESSSSSSSRYSDSYFIPRSAVRRRHRMWTDAVCVAGAGECARRFFQIALGDRVEREAT